MKQTLFFFLFFWGTTFNSLFAQNIQEEYILGTTKDIFVTEGKFFDNGGKEGNIQNQYFITTLHGEDSIEIYFEEFFIPDGALLNIYRGQSNKLNLVGSFGSKDKIYNILDEYITIEYVPAKYNVTPAKGFQGAVRKGHRGARASYPENDCPGAIPICNNLTVVALGGKYTELGAVNDDAGSCYSGTGNGGSVWYSFQPQADGPLDFTLTPTAGTDYDFVLWDITGGCGANQRIEKSCNFSVTQGPTGLSSVNCNEAIGSCTNNDCSTDAKASDCNRFNRRPSVLQSHKYAVCINIYGGSNGGFNLQFKNEASSVNITDVTPPTIVNATANSCPSASQFKLRFSEYVDCSTIQAADFTLPGHTITLNNTNCSNNSSTSVDVTITPTLTAGTYSLHAQDILDLCGNNMNSNFSIVIGASPNPTAATSGGICKSPGLFGIGFTYSPSSVTLTAGGGTYYQWSDGQVGASIGVSPTTTTTYTVTVTQGACPGTATVVVNVEAAPTPSIPDQNFCAGQSRTLTATGGGTYQWYTGPSLFGNGTAIAAPAGTAATLNASPSGTTTYRVIVTSPAGCKGQDDVTLTLVTSNCCNASITPVSLCSNDAPVTLSVGTLGGTFSGPGITNTTTGVFDPATAGVGSHKIYYTLGCGTDSAVMTVAGCTAVNVCKETNGNLTVSGGVAPFTWSVWDSIGRTCNGTLLFGNCIGTWVTNKGWKVFGGGATTVTPPAGKDTVKVVDGAGTTKTFYTIASIPACSSCPTLTVTPANQVNVKCFGQATGSFSVTTTGGASPYNYVLKNGATTVATFNAVAGSQPFTGLPAGTYTLNVTDANACSGSSTITIIQPAAALAVSTTPTATTCGKNNGSATSTVTGGTTNYTYVWNNGGGSASGLTNVAANTYTVTVTDANACTATASAVINTSTAVTFTSNIHNTTCGNTNGSIKLLPSGGNGIYVYTWSPNVSTTDSASNLKGTYFVTVTSGVGCSVSNSLVVQPSYPPSDSLLSVKDETCAGKNDGEISIQGVASTTYVLYQSTYPIFTDSINHGTLNIFSNLAPNTYILTIRDQNGCWDSVVATVKPGVPCCQHIITATNFNPTTCGGTDGFIHLTVTNKVGTLTFTWSPNVSANAVANNLGAGTYTVSVKDNGTGCTKDTTFTLTEPTPNITAFTTSNETCAGLNNGKIISATATNATGFSWGYALLSNPSAITPIASFPVNNLAPGTYILGIANPLKTACSDTVIFTITAATALAATAAATATTCGAANGTATATVTAGAGPFAYVWSNTQMSNPAISLAANSYTVTVTGAGGCTTTASATVNPSAAPNISAVATTDPTCAGQTNGSITSVTAAGGTGLLQFGYALASNPLAVTPILTFPVTNLAPNTYIVGVQDASSCRDTFYVTIGSGPTCCNLVIQSASATNPTCGNNNGSAGVTMAGGTPPYTYIWSANAATGNSVTASNLGAGTYSVTIQAGAGCQKDTSFTLAAPNTPNITAFNIVNEICLGNNDGSIVSASAANSAGLSWGYAPLANPAAITPIASFPVNNLAPGTYILGIADPLNQNCRDTVILTIAAGPFCCTLAYQNVAVSNPSCGNNNGNIAVSMTGGTGTYTYAWSANANTVNTGTASGLGAGTYTLTITSGAGCQKDTSFTLAAPSLPNITAFNTSNETCLNKNDGSITSATATSTAGLSWGYAPLSNPSTITPIASFPVNNLAPGTYILGIADPLNTSCSDTVILTIMAGPLCCNLSVSATITAPTCGNANGGIDVTVTQGSGNYQYTWNGTTQGQDTANIAAGSYAFHLDDLTQGCALDTTFVVNNSNGPQINSVSQSKESCAGLQDGSAWITATGISLNYLWSNGLPNNATQNGLAAGTYFFTVSDINNCSVTGNVTVALGGSLTVNNQLNDPSCLGNDGAINITSVLNGNPPYQYSLNYGGFGSNKNFASLSSGSYDVVVQDQKGCKDTVTYVLNAAVNNVSATLTATDPSCIGNDGVVDITNATGGTTPYQYSFNGAAFGATTNFSSLGAGGYTVIVKDNKSCADTLSANLVAANSFTVTTSTIDATCGVKNGELHFVMNGGKSPFQITDGGGANLALDNFGLSGGRIDYTVKDANQCTQSGFVVLTENPFSIKKLRSDTSLCGDATIDLDASNYPCYTHYLWSNGDTTATVTASTSGTYAVTITDDLGNVLYDSVHITLYGLPSISLPEDTFIYEGQSIVLNGTVSGGSGAGTYTWTPADLLTCSKCPSPKAVPRDSTTFTVVYTDQAGCEATDFINIAVLNDQSLYIPNAFSPNGDGKNDELKIYARFVKEFNWSVFNRWGEKVFETNDINFGWDGRYKGVLQPPSVYVYYLTVTYLNNKTVHNQGSVTLIR